jgi:S1-C subfamily serine protease
MRRRGFSYWMSGHPICLEAAIRELMAVSSLCSVSLGARDALRSCGTRFCYLCTCINNPPRVEQNGTTKRKQSPTSPTKEFPLKQIKLELDSHTSEGIMSHSLDWEKAKDDALSELPSQAHITTVIGQDTSEWQKTIEKAIKGTVSILYCHSHSFDAGPVICAQATGFVVDAEKGFILTNRHVVGAGPFIGYCIFDNHEECDVHPVYRDPVHDFGILRFDPKKIKYMPVTALKLRPDNAKVGVEIRIVGNDAGEKLSILSGVISRVDRNAPGYGERYSDFNTNYIQAAAAASGGSSGSPIVDRDGFAVAMQAGSRAYGAATDFFLPLDRPLRALELTRQGQPVSRGTIQTQWILKPFDECRRLGLSPALEKEIRTQFPKETGMLVAEVVLPQGPASAKVKEGDLLLRVNGELLTQFVRLDAMLDDNVGKTISVTIQRAGENMDVELDVGDLHAITPDKFVSVAGASFHNLSYQKARFYGISLRDAGVYVCEAAGSFRFTDGCTSGWLIQEVDNQPTLDLDAFIEVMKKIPDCKRVVVNYKTLDNLHTTETSFLSVDRRWHSKIRVATRNDTTGLWDYKTLADAIPSVPPITRCAKFVKMDSDYPKAADIVRSFVQVDVSMPNGLDGWTQTKSKSWGLVIDAENGFVFVSRATVQHLLCDISLLIADNIFVDAKIFFLHPSHNYAIVKYDVSLVNASVKTPKFGTKFIKKGAKTIFCGINHKNQPVLVKTVVTDVSRSRIPPNRGAPRYRATNVDTITVSCSEASESDFGVLISEDGTVQALWLLYWGKEVPGGGGDIVHRLGFATPNLLPVLNDIRSGKTPKLRILNVEFLPVLMHQARAMGVSEERIKETEIADPEHHQLLKVHKVDADHAGGLNEGDVLLTLNDKLVTCSPDLDVMCNNEFLDAVVVRKLEEKSIKVSTVTTEDFETDRLVLFCGATFQSPHRALHQHMRSIPSGVYLSLLGLGSPAYLYGVSTNFVFGSFI